MTKKTKMKRITGFDYPLGAISSPTNNIGKTRLIKK